MAGFDSNEVTILYRETKTVELKGEIVEDRPEGILVRHTYRKRGTRLEFIPREKLDNIYFDETKPTRKPRKAKAAEPKTPAPEPEPEVTEEDTGVEEAADEFDEDEFDDSGDDFDDEFE